MHDETPDGANGTLPLTIGKFGPRQVIRIVGGPFRAYRENEWTFGVNLKAEQPHANADIYLPIRDFNVPSDPQAVRDAIRQIVRHAIHDKKVWVGCMGGWGRTGLVLAIIAKTVGVKDPVAYVRKHYHSHAVETTAQQDYVAAFEVDDLRWLIRYERTRALLGLGMKDE